MNDSNKFKKSQSQKSQTQKSEIANIKLKPQDETKIHLTEKSTNPIKSTSPGKKAKD